MVRIDVNEQYMVTLREVYNPVIIRDESAGGVAVCERDGKIEVTWLKAGEDATEQIANSPASPVQQLKAEILPLLTDALEEFAARKFEHGKHYFEQAMAKLSAI